MGCATCLACALRLVLAAAATGSAALRPGAPWLSPPAGHRLGTQKLLLLLQKDGRRPTHTEGEGSGCAKGIRQRALKTAQEQARKRGGGGNPGFGASLISGNPKEMRGLARRKWAQGRGRSG